MPQLYFYVPDEVADKIRQEAKAADISISRYLAELVKRQVASEWPKGFFDDVVGGWQGERLTRPPQGDYERRESLGSKKA
jgi:hypothetical protein